MRAALAVILLTIATQAGAAEYECDITKKLDAENQYTAPIWKNGNSRSGSKIMATKQSCHDALFLLLLGGSPVRIMKLTL